MLISSLLTLRYKNSFFFMINITICKQQYVLLLSVTVQRCTVHTTISIPQNTWLNYYFHSGMCLIRSLWSILERSSRPKIYLSQFLLWLWKINQGTKKCSTIKKKYHLHWRILFYYKRSKVLSRIARLPHFSLLL